VIRLRDAAQAEEATTSAEERLSQRRLFNLDLRAEKDFVWSNFTFGVFADVFDVLNNQAVVDTTAGQIVSDPQCDPARSTCYRRGPS